MIFAQFGVSSAGLVLQKLLKEHGIRTRNVHAMIADLHVGLNFLYNAPDKRTFETLYMAWKKEFIQRANSLTLPEVVQTHLLNTIVGLCKQKRREYMINNGGLGKNQIKKLKAEYKKHYENFTKKVASFDS